MSNKSIGQFMAILRKANGMTQQEVADRLNVSNKAVSRWERDECAPDISLLPAIAEMFGVTCDELLKGERITEQAYEKKHRANRSVSNFKMMCWISMAISLIALVGGFGIAIAFRRPDIGFSVVLLIEVIAVLIVVMATNKFSENNDCLGTFSYWGYFTALTVVLLSLSMLMVYIPEGGNVGYNVYGWMARMMVVAILIHLKTKDRYISWINKETIKKEISDIKVGIMNWIQLVLIVTAAVIHFLFSRNGIEITSGISGNSIAVLSCLGASVIVFVVFVMICKDNRKQALYYGIRNILMMAVGILFAVHVSHAVTNGTTGVGVKSTFYYFGIDIYAAMLVNVVFDIVKRRSARGKKQKNTTQVCSE